MVSILKDMGVMDFEPRVVNQLLEFSYRYVSTILDDSKVSIMEPNIRMTEVYGKNSFLLPKIPR